MADGIGVAHGPDQSVEPPQSIEIVVDVIQQKRVQDLAHQKGGARIGHRLFVLLWFGRLVAQADHQHLVCPQPQRRRQWRVLAQTAVAEKSIAHRHRGKQHRQRGRCQRVLAGHGHELRAHEGILAPPAQRSAGALDEHHALARADVRGGDRQRLEQPAPVVLGRSGPGDQPAHDAFELAGVHDPAQPATAVSLFDQAAAQQRTRRRMNSRNPKPTISSRTKLSQRSTSMRPCTGGDDQRWPRRSRRECHPPMFRR